MTKKIKIFLFNRRTWIYNLQYIFISLIMLVFITYIDYNRDFFIQIIPSFFYTRLELARTVLSSLSSGLLAISIFAFSSILSMLTFYSGNFSPRVVENFVGKKITMKVLGIFIGGFTYCIASLNFMRGGDDDRLVLAGTVGMIYVLFCIIYLIIFIQKTIHDVQVVNLISDIYQEALPVITQEVQARDIDDGSRPYTAEQYTSIFSQTTGYFELFNIEKTVEVLADFDGILLIPVKTGDFIVEGQEIGRLLGSQDAEFSDLAEKLQSSFEIHENKLAITDYKFGLEKIKEIALMALSPGINDPATAIHGVRKIATLLCPLAATDEYHHIQELKSKGHIYISSTPFAEDLYSMIAPIANYGKSDPQVIGAVFESLMIILSSATEKNQQAILQLADDIYESSLQQINLEADRRHLTYHYDRLNSKSMNERTDLHSTGKQPN